MKEVLDKANCNGCTACMSVCPKGAITMEENKDGFKYPVIDQNKCIDCGLCQKTCHALSTKSNASINSCYVAYANEDKIKENASSGGIFPLIANSILDENGIVIGAAFDNENKLRHIAISKKEDLYKLKGSKYLQSDLDSIFKFVKENIEKNKILFVGVPCQVAGLKAFLNKEYENLICIDLICHGVPSPKLFEKYIKELEEQNNEKLINYNFRDKFTGWDLYSNTATFQNKKVTELQSNNSYMKLFLSDVALRESCYDCNFKLGNKYSDLTLGDFWGVKKYYPEMYNKKGVSAIIINTEKGDTIFNKIKNETTYKNCKLEEIVDGNPSLAKSSKMPDRRKDFFKNIEEFSINELVKKYIHKTPLWKKVLGKFKNIIKRIIHYE